MRKKRSSRESAMKHRERSKEFIAGLEEENKILVEKNIELEKKVNLLQQDLLKKDAILKKLGLGSTCKTDEELEELNMRLSWLKQEKKVSFQNVPHFESAFKNSLTLDFGNEHDKLDDFSLAMLNN